MKGKADEKKTGYTKEQLKKIRILLAALAGGNLVLSIAIIMLGNLKMGLTFIAMILFFTVYIYFSLTRGPREED